MEVCLLFQTGGEFLEVFENEDDVRKYFALVPCITFDDEYVLVNGTVTYQIETREVKTFSHGGE